MEEDVARPPAAGHLSDVATARSSGSSITPASARGFAIGELVEQILIEFAEGISRSNEVFYPPQAIRRSSYKTKMVKNLFVLQRVSRKFAQTIRGSGPLRRYMLLESALNLRSSYAGNWAGPMLRPLDCRNTPLDLLLASIGVDWFAKEHYRDETGTHRCRYNMSKQSLGQWDRSWLFGVLLTINPHVKVCAHHDLRSGYFDFGSTFARPEASWRQINLFNNTDAKSIELLMQFEELPRFRAGPRTILKVRDTDCTTLGAIFDCYMTVALRAWEASVCPWYHNCPWCPGYASPVEDVSSDQHQIIQRSSQVNTPAMVPRLVRVTEPDQRQVAKPSTPVKKTGKIRRALRRCWSWVRCSSD